MMENLQKPYLVAKQEMISIYRMKIENGKGKVALVALVDITVLT